MKKSSKPKKVEITKQQEKALNGFKSNYPYSNSTDLFINSSPYWSEGNRYASLKRLSPEKFSLAITGWYKVVTAEDKFPEGAHVKIRDGRIVKIREFDQTGRARGVNFEASYEDIVRYAEEDEIVEYEEKERKSEELAKTIEESCEEMKKQIRRALF